MKDKPIITALAPWFGGKRTLTPAIVEELGQHRAYWEPFCGGLAVLMGKPPAMMETINDLHGDLINLARVVQHETYGPMLYRRLRRLWMHEDEYDQAQGVIRADPGWTRSDDDFTNHEHMERALAYFIVTWLGRGGMAGLSPKRVGKSFAVRYTKNGGHGATRFRSAIDSIPAWRRRMRGVTILNRDGLAILDKIEDAPGVAIYCDPPYLAKNGEYLHDFNTADHVALAAALQRFRQTRIVVSYYQHPLIKSLYPPDRWIVREIQVSKATANQSARGLRAAKATELLIINGPSYSTDAQNNRGFFEEARS